MEEEKVNVKPLKTNPVDRTNILSELFFCWLLPYFVKGYKRELTEDDMYQHRKSHESKTLGDRLQDAWEMEVLKKNSPSLTIALLKVFRFELIFYNIMIIFTEATRFAHPYLIASLMELYNLPERSEEDQNKIYIYSALVVLASLVNNILIHCYTLQVSLLGMKMRIACTSVIYRKTLKLSRTVLVDTTIGKMVNLVANDVSRFDQAFHHIHHFWLGPVMTLVVFYLSYSLYGFNGTAGIFLLFALMPLQMFLGKKSSDFRLATAGRTDERVRLMNEIITGIQVIKMYTWEKPFAKIVELSRFNEVKYIKLAAIVKGFLMSLSLCSNRFCIAIAVIAYVATGNTLTSTYVYTVLAIYRIMNIFNMFFPMAISQLSELHTSVGRIQKVLSLDEKWEKSQPILKEKFKRLSVDALKPANGYFKEKIGFKLNNVTAKWDKSHSENNLENISMEVDAGRLVAIVGQVGSGKSSLLQTILKELIPSEGSVEVHGTVSYASQEPWLFGGTVRQNIVFGQKFDQRRYDEIIRVCALERDLSLLPYGDKTRIGERGVTLSGGQKARVNLARAVYKEADIYLLDDPLSAVDTHVGKQLFEDCISQYLSKKCVVLVTHQLQYLKNLEHIYLLEEGKVRTSGCYRNIRNSNSVFTKLLIDLEKEEEEEHKKDAKKGDNYENNTDEAPGLKKEEKSVGEVTSHVYKTYFRSGGHIIKVFLIVFGFIMSQALDSIAEYFVTIWVNVQQLVDQDQTKYLNLEHLNNENHTYKSVFVTPYYSSHQNLVDFYEGNDALYIYIAIIILLLLVSLARSYFFYMWCLKASTGLHNTMFRNIIRCPMQFFNVNPSGRILNRFSYDIGNIDEMLPMAILDTMQIGLSVIAISLVIGTLSPWIFIPTLVLLILFYFMRVVFLETSRDIKRIEAITRSPIFSHLTASFQGLTTIRAFKAQELLVSEFDKLQNLHSAAFFMYLGANRTFGFWLDFCCIVYIALVLVALICIKGETLGGNIGLAMTQAMALTGMFQWGIRQWSELENKMTSVERVQEYTELPIEKDGEVQDPSETWPNKGEVAFSKLSLRYSSELPYVLKNLSFIIKPQEKVGVVGRTGAGKSSIIQALFRLTDIEGSILIDGIDTQSVSLDKLRSKISIIPQEPVLFSGTLRKNLDPFDDYEDEVLWNALEEVELKSVIADLPDGLDNKMAEGGVNFSVGQRQLFCLARAIIRQNKILILDEATANVDLHTDSLIQTTIRNKFEKCTVITVAHRLHTIMDSDKVLVLDAGEILEYDSPHLLINNTDGVFYSLLMQTGPNTSKNLKKVAKEAYNLRQKSIED